ncbi:MAG: anti-sigma F factor [Oscillospiraceae bacterium]|nr:anti-sigma F factor [Oscillospiraceae bacterium]
MKPYNELKISFPSESCNEGIARMCITSFVSALDPTVTELAEIKTAVSEAVTNSIVHGYRGGFGKIEIYAKAFENRNLSIRITDHGCGIADIEKAMEPLYTSAPEEERAGLGFAVMESFMDKLTVKSTPGKGTTVTMQRKLSPTHNLHKLSERNSLE